MLRIGATVVGAWLAILGVVCGDEPVRIGSRRELLVDDSLLASMAGQIELRLHHPQARETSFCFDKPWEGNACGYATIIQDENEYRMYYRGHRYVIDDPPLRSAQREVVCYAESLDGIVWTRPELGLFEWDGSKANNIIWEGPNEAHNFAPFKDANPDCPPDQRYKAVGGTDIGGLFAFKSADGVRWSRLFDEAIFTEGAFDSHNTAFWDPERRQYALYYRYFSEGGFEGLRSIGVSFSEDFQHWTKPVPLDYGDSPAQQMYTNQILPYYRAPHIVMGFPTRYVARPLTPHARTLPSSSLRSTILEVCERCATDLTDGLFMTSRSGLDFRRWDEAFLRPGPQAEGRWLYGDNYQSYGLWETQSELPGGSKEISMHFTEGTWLNDKRTVRRYTIRLDGFVSANAGYGGGELVTKPVIFDGGQLRINYATSAAGSVRVELQDVHAHPLPGFTLAEASELYGDSVDQVVSWEQGADVRPLAGKPIRLRFALQDADLYSFQFHDR